MAAAEKTPTSVQKTYSTSTSTYGTPIRVIRYFVVVTATVNADWIDGDTYCPGTYLGSTGYLIDGSADGEPEVMSYVDATAAITMSSGVAGTKYIEVLCQEA